MTKLMIIALLAATTLLVSAYKSPKVTRFVRKSTLLGNAVTIDKDLFVLSRDSTKKTQLHISPNDETSYKPCTVHLDVVLDDQIQAAALWRKIVIWNSSPSSQRYDYAFFLIDPRTCTHKKFAQLRSTSSHKPEVIVYEDRLDIFYPGQPECMPCSFNANGKQLNAEKRLHYQTNFRIRAIGRTSRRYVFVYDVNGQPQRELLNEQFSRQFGYYYTNGTIVKDVAVNSVGDKSFIGIVSMQPMNSSMLPQYSLVSDSNMEDIFQRYLPELGGYTLERIYVNIDSRGNSYVTLVQSEDQISKLNSIVTVVVYDVDGHLVDEILLTKRIYEGVKSDWNEHTFLIADREFCLFEQMRQNYAKEITQIKCIEI